MKWRDSGTGIGAFSATAESIRDGALCRYGPRLRLPTSMPASRSTQSAWASSLISDCKILTAGRTWSVEVGDTVIMFESRDHNERSTTKPGAGCGIRLTVLLPHDYDIDTSIQIAPYSGLRRQQVPIACEIGNRFWGNRDFTVRDPDEYHLTFARQVRE